MRHFIRSSFHLLNTYLLSAWCIRGTVLRGREILIFVFRVVGFGIWTVRAILFHAYHGGGERKYLDFTVGQTGAELIPAWKSCLAPGS